MPTFATPLNKVLRHWLCASSILAIISIPGFGTEPNDTDQIATQHPNVLVFLSDDQGWGDFGFQGNTNFHTPNLDRLADSGVVCQRFYVCPVCAPTRAEFLTGRYHPRSSTMGVTQGDERMDLDETTLADRFKLAGYATGAFGKWHNGSQFPYHPNGRGFQEFYGFCSGHWGDYFSPPLDHNGKKVQGDGFVTDDFTTHAMEFIRLHAKERFFCYVAFNTPHSPMQVPDEFMKRVHERPLAMQHQGRASEKEDPAMTRAAIAMVENIDSNVGRILNLLDQLHLRDQTIIVYFNDNGPNSFRWNGGMKGRKGTVDEGGVRSPLIVSWPSHLPAQQRLEQLTGAIDIAPTLCELAGIPMTLDPHHPLDGISIAQHLTDPTKPLVHRKLFSQWSGRIAMRQDQFLLDYDGAIFNLIDDPTQQRDLIATQNELANSMTTDVSKWREEVLRSARTNRPFLIGHPERNSSILPAQDGKCQGPSVKRSDTAPNCSYFTNLRTPEDKLTWNILPMQSGTYSVWIEYTATQAATGKRIAVKIGQDEIVKSIDDRFESPSRGQSNDRVPRKSESFMKDFQSLELGTMQLSQETMDCQLRLLDPIVEPGMVEIQSVEFRKNE
ncbi:MAG: arylsulfatase [Pirellula sp.]